MSSQAAQSLAAVEAGGALLGRDFNAALVHQVAVAVAGNARQATRAQKSRGQINRSGKKPWRQKGTGRARSGTAASNIWRGGGRAFPAMPNENFKSKINRKMFRAAMACALSQLAREGRLAAAELSTAQVKTKEAAAVVNNFRREMPAAANAAADSKIKNAGLRRLLLVDTDFDKEEGARNFALAARNLPDVWLLSVGELTPAALLSADAMVATQRALQEMEKRWAS